MDDDNLASSQKHIRDGIADALHRNDGDPRLKWLYWQRKRKIIGPQKEEVGTAVQILGRDSE